jgi:phage shock protein A
MEINEKYLNERLKSLNEQLARFQQQYGQAQQMLNQNQANINVVLGGISDTKQTLAYLKQKEPSPVLAEEPQVPPEA